MGREEETMNKKRDLFETKSGKGRLIYRLFSVTIFIGICLIWVYRLSHIPKEEENGKLMLLLGWFGLLFSELWFGFYWILTQSFRWKLIYRHTFKDRLSQRYKNDELPRVDIFVCTADPKIEPPKMVVNTVLSVMAYDYPPDKLSVYLSDDAGSDLTFYALLEAFEFSKHWIPYCKEFDVEPRSPFAYFKAMSLPSVRDSHQAAKYVEIKKLYKDMENRIDNATKYGQISEEEKSKHKGFSHWDSSYLSRYDHDTILKILIDGKDSKSKDIDGCPLPTLVYLAREKRPNYPHNFKAGAMNALIRVSSKISNGDITLNVDCDMYSNNSASIKDALCFLMDEKEGKDIAFVQFPQVYDNVTKNDLYGSEFLAIRTVEFPGMDGYGGPMYIGSGCFHRREILSGGKFRDECDIKEDKILSVHELEERSKVLASCAYEEENTQWGKEIGLKYGCPVEDVITGLSIQTKGWKSVNFGPSRHAFLGVAPVTLAQVLVQHKRWSEGDFQVLLSKYSPAWYAYNKISFGLQLGYCAYCLWAPNCLPTLYYSLIPSLFLLKGVPLFPQVSSLWFIPFAYVVIAKYTYSLGEFLWSEGTALGWWNEQRMWLYKRVSSYLFGFFDTVLNTLGFKDSGFVISAKVADEDVTERYKKEIMEFGTTSPMFVIISTIAMVNLYCFIGVVVKEVAMGKGFVKVFETMVLQVLLCGVLVVINLPLYEGLFVRKDKGKMPSSVMVKSVSFALFACTCFAFM